MAAGARQTDAARAQGLSPTLLGHWQRPALAEAVLSSAELEKIKRLRAELRRVEQERDMLKKSRDHLCATTSVMSRYQFIKQVASTKPVHTEPVQVLCCVLEVSATGYYQWLRRVARPIPGWESAATAAFSRPAQRYGTRRLRAELRAVGRYAPGYAATASGR